MDVPEVLAVKLDSGKHQLRKELELNELLEEEAVPGHPCSVLSI